MQGPVSLPPLYDTRLPFYREKGTTNSTFFPRRLASNCAYTHARRYPQSIWFEIKNPMAGLEMHSSYFKTLTQVVSSS